LQRVPGITPGLSGVVLAENRPTRGLSENVSMVTRGAAPAGLVLHSGLKEGSGQAG